MSGQMMICPKAQECYYSERCLHTSHHKQVWDCLHPPSLCPGCQKGVETKAGLETPCDICRMQEAAKAQLTHCEPLIRADQRAKDEQEIYRGMGGWLRSMGQPWIFQKYVERLEEGKPPEEKQP